jgi:hypothetical protein
MRGKPSVRIRLTYRRLIIGLSLISISTFFGLFIYLNIGHVEKVKADGYANETLSTGSFIIDMGQSPQTYANGLKPYGMLCELLKTYKVPIKWVINSSKSKDGVDFTYKGSNYSGGPFIIPAEYITAAVALRITYWQTQGVVGVYTTSAISVPVYCTLTIFPTVTIDNLSNKQTIITQYYVNAGIPSSAYITGNPSTLTSCVDIWTNPHGDPSWSTHGYLRDFVLTSKSWIFAQCHSVSMMEGCWDATNTYGLNFLTAKGLKCYNSGNCGSITETHAGNATTPVTYSNPSHPVMQFLGDMYGATTSGSENWYQPVSTGGGWNSKTLNLGATADGSGNKKGSVLAFGPAYNDPTNGNVLYEGGHDLDGSGTTANKVAAQRAYFNFVLMGGYTKSISVKMGSVPTTIKPGETFNVSVTATGAPGASFSYQWSSLLGGTFTNSTNKNTVYKAPAFTTNIIDQLRVTVTDNCGRSNFDVNLVPGDVTLPVTLISFDGKRNGKNVDLKWSTASEVNNAYFTIERSPDGKNFVEAWRVEGGGTTSTRQDYSWTDEDVTSNECYYRISQTDLDGKTEQFNVIFIEPQKEMHVEQVLSPRPSVFTSSFNFEIQSDDSREATLIIASMKGDLVDKVTYNLHEGNNLLVYNDEKQLPVGIYLAIFNDGRSKAISTKVVKQ